MMEFDHEVQATRQRLLREQGALTLAFEALKYFVRVMEEHRKEVAQSGKAILVRPARLGALIDISMIMLSVSVVVLPECAYVHGK